MEFQQSNYNKFPEVKIPGYTGFIGWDPICNEIRSRLSENASKKIIIVLECYHGVMSKVMIAQLKQRLKDVRFINAEEALLEAQVINEKFSSYITNDSVFGYITPLSIRNFYDDNKLKSLKDELADSQDAVTCVFGTGASIIAPKADLLLYADMPRWEVQLRFRRQEVGNLGACNTGDSFASLYKRAFFVDWRVCDRLKKEVLPLADYVIDTTINEEPKMISGAILQNALRMVGTQPFRVVPFFDPGPWGGQWLKEVCDLDRSSPNYAWAFDCVPEENSLLLRFDDLLFETPSINVVFFQTEALLGKLVMDNFGAEFPIRFDFLDTVQGGNLSLQVHPLKDYIKKHFGMEYTQDESYYMMDARPGAVVYLGLKENVQPDLMMADLKKAQVGEGDFEADTYVQTWPVKKHDHVLIPAGTVHCSGTNGVVLEISATPYIFTFKLWDWGRMGLDGKPRPISLEHGKNNIQWDRTTNWTQKNLLNRTSQIAEGEGWIEERTGLHDHFFIETRRHWFTKKVMHHTNDVVNVINLVEGREIIVESPTNQFEPFIVHYAETFIVPAAVGDYTIRPHGESEGTRCATLKAFVNVKNLPQAS